MIAFIKMITFIKNFILYTAAAAIATTYIAIMLVMILCPGLEWVSLLMLCCGIGLFMAMAVRS